MSTQQEIWTEIWTEIGIETTPHFPNEKEEIGVYQETYRLEC